MTNEDLLNRYRELYRLISTATGTTAEAVQKIQVLVAIELVDVLGQLNNKLASIGNTSDEIVKSMREIYGK